MKILAIVGSPRKAGNTDIMVERMLEGAEECGAEARKIYLNELKVGCCQACGHCSTAKPWDGCAMRDDMIAVHEALKWCDAFIVGTPIHFFGPSSQTHVFIDRLYCLINSDKNGDKHALRGKRMALAFAYGGKDPFSSGAMNAYAIFRDIATFFGIKLIGVVYGSAMDWGEITENDAVLSRARELGRSLCNCVGTGGVADGESQRRRETAT